MRPPTVCLQVNVAASDLRYLVHSLPHQLRVLEGQVDEVVLTADTAISRGTKYRMPDFPQRLAELRAWLAGLQAASPKIRVVEVDYGPEAMARVGRLFLGGAAAPRRAANGTPFYAYLFGMAATACDYVLHLDADMVLGGGSQAWVAEAVALMEADPRIFACNPFPGPPRADGRLLREAGAPYPAPFPALRFETVSTRVMMFDRRRFAQGALRIPLQPAAPRMRLQAALYNTPPYDLLERYLTQLLRVAGLCRVDLLGSAPGLWSLHPEHRTASFFRDFPEVIRRVEAGDVPEAQRGDYEINDSMIDWSEARAGKTLQAKLRRHLRYAASGLAERLEGLRGRP